MNRNNPDLHGQAPDEGKVALLLVDVINPFDFEDGPKLLQRSLPAARHLAHLKSRFKDAQLPVIYCNDNFGRWRSNVDEILAYCLSEESTGRELVQLLQPSSDDYFVLKPKESAFYETVLELLLDHLHVEALVIGGFTADICVLLTAKDAYLRDYQIYIPEDGVASVEAEYSRQALVYAQRVLGARVRPTDQLDPPDLHRSLHVNKEA